MKTVRILLSLLTSLALFGCTSMLKEEVYSQLDPATAFLSASGVERVLFSAYANSQINGNFGGNILFQEEWTCDQFWETGGAVNQQAVPMLNFTFDAGYPTHWHGLWANFYASIRNCNIVLENIDQAPLTEATKAQFIAEARFVRAIDYYKCLMLWGGVPLRLNTQDPADMARASAEQVGEFIEKELLDVVDVLPDKAAQYGRATRGAARGFLCKYYLNTKQWQKAADMAQAIIRSGYYELWADYTTLFMVENERTNKEFIWAYTCSPLGPGNEMMNGAFPQNFAQTVDGKIKFLPNMRNWARQDRVWDSFYNSFDPSDKRLGLFVTEYIDNTGKKISLLNKDNIRAFKYTPDVNAVSNAHGNDIPVIRYADILLARAEALNELDGPTQESLDLFQQVRNRAGLTRPFGVSDFTKESLRERILQERAWEFYGEDLRREDLIRNGSFISRARERLAARGITTKIDDHFLVFPIPQPEIDANPLCKQNPGY